MAITPLEAIASGMGVRLVVAFTSRMLAPRARLLAVERDDRDLPAGLLLVLREEPKEALDVRPDALALGALERPRRRVERLVRELDLHARVGDEVVVPARRLRRTGVRGDDVDRAGVAVEHHRRRPLLLRFGALRREQHEPLAVHAR